MNTTPENTKKRDLRAVYDQIEHEAIQQGLPMAKVAPLLEKMISVKTQPGTGLFSINGIEFFYEIDWAPFNKVVDENRPLDVRTLGEVLRRLDGHIYKAERDEEKYNGTPVKPVKEVLVYLKNEVRGMITEAQG